MRRYADDTAVSVGRSRGEIDDLLRGWHADGIRWTDVYSEGRTQLEFLWTFAGTQCLARFEVKLPDAEALKKHARDGRNGAFSETKLQKLLESRGRQEHRVLLLWLKAAFNAIEIGIVSAETVFLPFLVGTDGRTFAEVALPLLPKLASGNALMLLPPQVRP